MAPDNGVSPQVSAVDYRERDIKIKLARKLPLGARGIPIDKTLFMQRLLRW
jgi:hypothetical protein